MSFPFNVYAVGFIAAMFFSAISFPLWRRFCIAVGHVDDPGHRKIHSAPMPLAGGLTVMTGFFLPVVLGAAAIFLLRPVEAEGMARGLFEYGVGRRAWQLIAVLGGALGMVLLGWWDDKHELKPRSKKPVRWLPASPKNALALGKLNGKKPSNAPQTRKASVATRYCP